jgi:hypothetical protein
VPEGVPLDRLSAAEVQNLNAMEARVYDMTEEDCERWYAEHPVEMFEEKP